MAGLPRPRAAEEERSPAKATGSHPGEVLRAREEAADLVVMTTLGRGPVSRAFLGSVADELVRRCPVPVLLVRPGQAKAIEGMGGPSERCGTIRTGGSEAL